MHSFRTFLVVLASSLAFVSTAVAATDTDSLDVTASVVNSCQITGGSLAFGAYDTIGGAAVDASGTISVECTSGASATITMGQGSNADTGSTDAAPLRRVNDGGTNHLSYSLFQDAGRTTAWGDTVGTSKGYTAVNADAASQTVYGRLAANQDVPAGSYTDTVVATITF